MKNGLLKVFLLLLVSSAAIYGMSATEVDHHESASQTAHHSDEDHPEY
ncbi:hypothetical protein [Thalassobacillus hwangdonensis]|uniref:Uncharacterized protein n=1 Tax=Thalassobacillus hwangdonensis TaxID=546108 RepID=A0ABW3L1C4_9BACI